MSKLNYTLYGDDFQYVVFDLAPNECVMAEAGAMMYMTQQVEMETHFGRPDEGEKGFMDKVFSAGKRIITGESLFITTFTQQGSPNGKLAFAAPIPGKIINLDLQETGVMLCQKDSYLCSSLQVNIDVAFTKKFGAGFFGGEGFILQKLSGSGTAFCNAGGTIAEIELKEGEQLKVDTGCIVAFQESVGYNIEFVGNIKSALFGGEGLFYAQLTGPGKVYLQTLPFSRLAGRIFSAAPQGGGKQKGEGSLLGTIGSLIDGDNR